VSNHPADSPRAGPLSEHVFDANAMARAEWEGLPESRSARDAAASNLQRPDRSPMVERRRTPRGVTGYEPHRAHLVSRTLGSYAEMPGLALTVTQAARLFGISSGTCQLVLDALVEQKRLAQDARGQYIR